MVIKWMRIISINFMWLNLNFERSKFSFHGNLINYEKVSNWIDKYLPQKCTLFFSSKSLKVDFFSPNLRNDICSIERNRLTGSDEEKNEGPVK